MKLSTRGRYATRALLDIAMHQHAGPVQLKDVAARQAISPKYLDQLLTQLRNAGLIRACRGPHGGFELTREPCSISLSDIINVMEGRTAVVDCVADARVCARSPACVTRDVWIDVSKAIDAVLEPITLEVLIERVRGREQAM